MQGTVAEAIERAALEVFALVVGFDIVAEPAGQSGWPQLDSNVVSSFRLSGSVSGTAQVYYTLPLAKRLTCVMLQLDSTVVETDVLDAAGEIANMIVGNVKNVLERQLGPIQIGTPAIEITGDSDQQRPAMSVSFRCSSDQFTVSVAFQEDRRRWDN